MNRAREHVWIALDDVERFLSVELVDPPRVRAASPWPRKKTVSSRKPDGRATLLRSAAQRAADAGNFAHALGSVVEHLAECVAEVLRDSPRKSGADAFYFRG